MDQQGGEISSPIKRQPTDGLTGNYFIPKSNPWYGVEAALEEFWALGFRNPFRMWLDRETGKIWLGDVGGEDWEEQNLVEKGDNGQWAYMEGLMKTDRPKPREILGREIEPLYTYEQNALERAAVGGFVYRSGRYPDLYGKYIFADNNSGVVYALDPSAPYESVERLAKVGLLGQHGITSLQQTPGGEILVTALGSKQRWTGRLFRLTRQRGASEPDQQSPPTVETVKHKFLMVCSRCHGEVGQGVPNLPGLDQPADFTLPEWQTKTTDEQIKNIILNGGGPVGKSLQMPPFKGYLSDIEADLMVQYIRELATPREQ